MTDLPTIKDGRLPLGEARSGQCHRGVDWKSARLIQCMITGIAEEIDDAVCGLIPANTPLDLRQAARAVNMKQRRARALQTDANFQSAFRAAIEAYRESQEPRNIATCMSLRDDPTNRPKERIRAIEVLRGPRPVAGTVVNVNQNNGQPQPAGYVINLTGRPIAEVQTDDDAPPKIIEGNAGNFAQDVEQERADAAAESVRLRNERDRRFDRDE